VEEEANVQAEASEKKTTSKPLACAPMEVTGAEIRKARGQGFWHNLLDCMPTF